MYLVSHFGYEPIEKYDFLKIFTVLYEAIELLICHMMEVFWSVMSLLVSACFGQGGPWLIKRQ